MVLLNHDVLYRTAKVEPIYIIPFSTPPSIEGQDRRDFPKIQEYDTFIPSFKDASNWHPEP
jgi:hypothetical protein